jgi:EAL domain-containing protein (putative c-di-GMP-specific phosphodiesterase class I)
VNITQHDVFGCNACKNGDELPFSFSMAFQPIVDVSTQTIYAYEALVRGANGEPSSTVLSQVTDANRYAFDQGCRVKSICLATQLGLVEAGARLSINFMPGAVYSPAACIQLTLKTAQSVGFPVELLIFEITETERVHDRAHLRAIVSDYKQRGFKVALDDLGAGYSGLSLLADTPTDIIKLDMSLIRNLNERPVALKIVESLTTLAVSLGCEMIAEGVETIEEYAALRACGISLMQGYLFAKPEFERLPSVVFPVAPTQ